MIEFIVKFDEDLEPFNINFGSIQVIQQGDVPEDVTVTPDKLLASITAYSQSGKITGNIQTYSGDYEVTPMITSQRLETDKKYMDDDVRIHTIPTTETLNGAGGYTFKIG